ncbi:hypothetical protein [Shewanella baltica]|uniref:hypothetical protein n=1 Tax=Shewanella baltica TaxID=62322 RepID=UPI0021699E4C|nr:hypothetical protein [Shewanella baltica]MCS6116717.1 hypothetical protein [Shewanella baltica]UVW63963.1 hypothetical protein HHE93_10355 [Shewanella baltica]
MIDVKDKYRELKRWLQTEVQFNTNNVIRTKVIDEAMADKTGIAKTEVEQERYRCGIDNERNGGGRRIRTFEG